MYGTLSLPHHVIDELTDVAGDAAIRELRSLARPIEGLRVLNLSTTGFGTGTAELLGSAVPLLTDLGLDCHWQVVRASEEAIAVNRAMYQALGGVYVAWTGDMTERWLRYAEMNADLLTEPFDVIIVHDPQPAAIRSYAREHAGIHGVIDRAKWVMHSHLDLSTAQEDVWLLLRGHIERYDAMISEAPSFARDDISVPAYVVPPAINPNSARNMPLPQDMMRTVLERYGIDPDRPLVVQVSPCDQASDLVGAIDTICLVRERVPGVQGAILLTTEPTDPQGRACYDALARRCADEDGVFILNTGAELGNVELNVFQRAASVVMQKGLRKGYGLWVSDALWKERPVVVAPVPGLTEQVIDGETGLVADGTAGFADAVSRLLLDRDLAAKLGENGRRYVAERFLITRYLKDYLQILNALHKSRSN